MSIEGMERNGVDNKVIVVLGSQWGDEGKGKLVDLLAEKVDVVARCQGGNNAGHTVICNHGKFAFHLLPSGLVHPNVKAVLGNGVVIHIEEFLSEIETNEAKGMAKVTPERLRISDRAHIVFDFHRVADRMQEDERKNSQTYLGTTKKGIGPCYSTKAARSGIRVGDLVGSDFEGCFVEKFQRLAKDHEKTYGTKVDVPNEIERYKILASRIKPYVDETVSYIHRILSSGEKILVEGANASMLDIDFGTYPYVTSSNCSIGGVCTGLGIPPGRIGEVYGVVKAYTTRVGAGAFPTELQNELGEYLQATGAEFGVTTGRKRRCGWLDLAMLKFTHSLNGFAALALTKLDILSGLDEVKIGVSYQKNGIKMEHYPSSEQDFENVQVDYLSLPGWNSDITGIRKFEDLPDKAQVYVKTIEDILNVPIKWVGVGPAREQMIERL